MATGHSHQKDVAGAVTRRHIKQTKASCDERLLFDVFRTTYCCPDILLIISQAANFLRNKPVSLLAMPSATTSHDEIKAELGFIDQDEAPPPAHNIFYLTYKPHGWDDNSPLRNFGMVGIPDVPIRDARSIMEDLSLEKEGFMIMNDTSCDMQQLNDGQLEDELVREVFEPFWEELKERLGAQLVFFLMNAW